MMFQNKIFQLPFYIFDLSYQMLPKTRNSFTWMFSLVHKSLYTNKVFLWISLEEDRYRRQPELIRCPRALLISFIFVTNITGDEGSVEKSMKLLVSLTDVTGFFCSCFNVVFDWQWRRGLIIDCFRFPTLPILEICCLVNGIY